MSLLSQLLAKRGIETVENLSSEEREVYNRYKFVLSGEAVTVDSIREFCATQIKVIEEKFASETGTFDSNVYLKACLHVYLNIQKAIDSPRAERESLEKHLTQLINS